MGYTYSFLDVQAAIDGPGGNFPLAGDEAGIAQEGITIAPTGEVNVMSVGADGAYMHSLKGDKSGTVTVRLLRTSTVNRQLQEMYNHQTRSSSYHGRNTITVRDVRGATPSPVRAAPLPKPRTKCSRRKAATSSGYSTQAKFTDR